MTEEEKKAIEEIKKFKFTESEKVAEENGLEHAEFARFLTIYHRKQLNILFNLIEKLKKENEEKDKIIFQVRDYVEPLMTEYEDGDYSIKEYCKSYIVNELLKGIFNKEYIYKGILREIITKPTIITDNDDYISVGKIIELLEEE